MDAQSRNVGEWSSTTIDNTIAHEDVITRDVRLYRYNNSRMAERIFTKFGTDVMPMEAVPNS
jgi:hypothetical protein